ncbi:SGNH/GDSL hydrolase family protein [Nocardioides sp. Bht2]|uniref:SGNH/GDSL hydrolase family protein n=1 Tax=Nocardioides sp. Bht2 TaxID=3392297 RepID=UPI0039B6D170
MGNQLFSRYVALGDSFSEGVGDPDPTRPNGLRGWADRTAEQLALGNPEFRYANLAIRGRKMPQIIAEQIEPAVALQPDLITIYAGGNDILRPKVDIDALVASYDDAVGRLADTGATLVMWTAFDAGTFPLFKPTRGRFAIYNELVREVAEKHGALVLDFWRAREYRDPRYWDSDRLHMAAPGHQQMAIKVLDLLGVAHTLTAPTLPEVVPVARREQMRNNAAWMRGEMLPWVQRRVTGRSSGDTISPKRPDLAPVE